MLERESCQNVLGVLYYELDSYSLSCWYNQQFFWVLILNMQIQTYCTGLVRGGGTSCQQLGKILIATACRHQQSVIRVGLITFRLFITHLEQFGLMQMDSGEEKYIWTKLWAGKSTRNLKQKSLQIQYILNLICNICKLCVYDVVHPLSICKLRHNISPILTFCKYFCVLQQSQTKHTSRSAHALLEH